MTDVKGSSSGVGDASLLQRKEWDEILCPVCMDHPHNAVLLLCSSYEKGCRPYVCDTSHRHSNCLDRLKNHKNGPPCGGLLTGNAQSFRHGQSSLAAEHVHDLQRTRRGPAGSHGAPSLDGSGGEVRLPAGQFTAAEEEETHNPAPGERMDLEEPGGGAGAEKNSILKCPLCRGVVLGYRIEDEVRHYLDLKPRSCSRESCAFSGNYRELRRHARRVHPSSRPADADPSRQRAWRHLEHEREVGDIISALQSTSPGAIVIGDYVIDNGEGLLQDWESSGSGRGGRSWWTTFFMLQMLHTPLGPAGERRGLVRSWRTHRRSGHRNMWDLNLPDLQDGDETADGFLNGDEVPAPRRRRRFSRSRADEDGQEGR
ncbi:unnamed protein product [Spirodela intermedia]|uniref:Uncharacterized protein n=1 Tax=Spirodela intermedia TaxID=51605 RepID=A0A7I8KZR9_SPIIN|nr:unnamed protein product [Spirodela intermedia]